MKTKTFEQLHTNEKKLIRAAQEAKDLAYAPYSNFQVGVSIAMENENIIKGANQENAAYPLCLCGERVALSYAAMHHPSETMQAMAIATSKILPDQIAPAPCGACRQVIKEYDDRQGKPIKIYLVGENEVYIFDTIDELLPFSFSAKNLL